MAIPDRVLVTIECPTCKGSGKVSGKKGESSCSFCNGSGKISGWKAQEPAGTIERSRIVKGRPYQPSEFNEARFIGKIPTPNNDVLRDYFIAIVNVFGAETESKKLDPDTPVSGLAYRKLILTMSELLNISISTSKERMMTLVKLGWFKVLYGDLQNPILTYVNAVKKGSEHPAVQKNKGAIQ